MKNRLLSYLVILFLNFFYEQATKAQTEITKWYHGKKGAVSVTFDDGSVNQFHYALPILENLHMPGTFYIITGPIAGSKYHGKFIGRPVSQ